MTQIRLDALIPFAAPRTVARVHDAADFFALEPHRAEPVRDAARTRETIKEPARPEQDQRDLDRNDLDQRDVDQRDVEPARRQAADDAPRNDYDRARESAPESAALSGRSDTLEAETSVEGDPGGAQVRSGSASGAPTASLEADASGGSDAAPSDAAPSNASGVAPVLGATPAQTQASLAGLSLNTAASTSTNSAATGLAAPNAGLRDAANTPGNASGGPSGTTATAADRASTAGLQGPAGGVSPADVTSPGRAVGAGSASSPVGAAITPAPDAAASAPLALAAAGTSGAASKSAGARNASSPLGSSTASGSGASSGSGPVTAAATTGPATTGPGTAAALVTQAANQTPVQAAAAAAPAPVADPAPETTPDAVRLDTGASEMRAERAESARSAGATHAPGARVDAAAVASLAAKLAKRAADGATRFQIRLDPAELGRVDVRLDVERDGVARAHLIVERPETFADLSRNARALERALAEAGVSVARDGVEISLADERAQDGFAQAKAREDLREGGREGGREGARDPSRETEGASTDARSETAEIDTSYGFALVRAGRTDLVI